MILKKTYFKNNLSRVICGTIMFLSSIACQSQTFDPQPVTVHDLTQALIVAQKNYNNTKKIEDNAYLAKVFTALTLASHAAWFVWCILSAVWKNNITRADEKNLKNIVIVLCALIILSAGSTGFAHKEYQETHTSKDLGDQLLTQLENLCKKANNNTACVC